MNDFDPVVCEELVAIIETVVGNDTTLIGCAMGMKSKIKSPVHFKTVAIGIRTAAFDKCIFQYGPVPA